MAYSADEWSRRVGMVFDVRPRVAIDDLSRWIERKEEKKFRSAITSSGLHVCLYGPSGSGKTSLAKSIIGRLNKRGKTFLYKLNHNSEWNSFKSQIVENKSALTKGDKPFNFKIGINHLLPYFEISGQTQPAVLGADLRSSIIEAIDIKHLARFIVDNNVCLVVDDVNFATDELLKMLTSLAKEITDNSESDNAKIVFVGADDIFTRIMSANESLRDRTEEISLGSIRGDDGEPSTIRRDKAWHFIADGLVTLGLTDPRKDRNISKDELQKTACWVEYAADGLPKSIVMLGRKIAENGAGRSRISFADIMNSSEEMIRRNFRLYRAKYRTLFSLLRENEVSEKVCAWMFDNGAARIHTLEEVAEDLSYFATYTMFDEGIRYLAAAEFLVVTGAGSNVFFARDPLLAHTLGVAMMHRHVLGSIGEGYFSTDKNAEQLLLRFVGEREPETRTKV